ncbi:hypothetical protein F7Q92_07690 [Ideonella dechloratans]|uniref:Uncharacterized protein n=1 Tax=Ideonella dechloratans TaxID=36863 RepID=A0A643FEB9_IDEDE|nr:hypothetical protein [Ideonella dechloratans]KAB0583548.1 hypothetical protein F7Q92_07690 [Ideonella dechloratans]UFU09037.1 hypothetical protein LRM40_12020 [Ideonella dechloratans]
MKLFARVLSALAAVGSLVSSALWLISASQQKNAASLASSASSLVMVAASDTINSQQRDLLINAAHGASTAANALGMISIDMNLYAAISAFLTGVAVLLIAFKD